MEVTVGDRHTVGDGHVPSDRDVVGTHEHRSHQHRVGPDLEESVRAHAEHRPAVHPGAVPQDQAGLTLALVEAEGAAVLQHHVCPYPDSRWQDEAFPGHLGTISASWAASLPVGAGTDTGRGRITVMAEAEPRLIDLLFEAHARLRAAARDHGVHSDEYQAALDELRQLRQVRHEERIVNQPT